MNFTLADNSNHSTTGEAIELHPIATLKLPVFRKIRGNREKIIPELSNPANAYIYEVVIAAKAVGVLGLDQYRLCPFRNKPPSKLIFLSE